MQEMKTGHRTSSVLLGCSHASFTECILLGQVSFHAVPSWNVSFMDMSLRFLPGMHPSQTNHQKPK